MAANPTPIPMPTVRSIHERLSADEMARTIRRMPTSSDVIKTILSQLDPSPFDPFHAIQIFGQLLAGTNADPVLVAAAGTAFHLVNGTSFGVAYLFLFARDGAIPVRRALLTGVGWGLFLETFQLTLYPGWLDIRLYQEFATISALSHIAYGATLGLLARWVLRRVFGEPAADQS